MLAVLIRTLCETHQSPSSLLIALEEKLAASLTQGTFITIFFGILDPTRNSLTYASAAHCPLLVYRKATGEIEWFKTRGIPLGTNRDGTLAQTLDDYVVNFEAGDLALQFTDGLNEAWNPARKEQYGFARIESLVKKYVNQGHKSILANLKYSAQAWADPEPLSDDLTLLSISWDESRIHHHSVQYDLQVPEVRHISPTAQFKEMVNDLYHLSLPADLEQLHRVNDWLNSCSGIQHFKPEDKLRIESGLYEICANIIEHGCGEDISQHIDVWWLPAAGQPNRSEKYLANEPSDSARNDESRALGYFIVGDRGTAYDPANWEPSNLYNPQVRRQGRGLGLQIAHATMTKITYSPATRVGNITMLRVDSRNQLSKEETSHVRSV